MLAKGIFSTLEDYRDESFTERVLIEMEEAEKAEFNAPAGYELFRFTTWNFQ